MDHLCMRCTRQALRGSHAVRRKTITIHARPFSQTSTSSAGPIDLSQAPGDAKSPKSTSGSATTPRSSPAKPSSSYTYRSWKPSPQPEVLTRKPSADTNSSPNKSFGRSTDRPGSTPGVLTRSGPPRSDRTNSFFNKDNSAGQVLRQSGPPRGRPGQGGRPPSSGYGKARSPNRGPRVDRVTGGGGRGGFGSGGRGRGLTDEEYKAVDGMRADRSAAASKAAEDRDEYIDDLFEEREVQLHNEDLNNGLPLNDIPYVPAEQTLEELRKDWPDTPLSATGLTEGLVQKLNFLARDLPHGYWTPKQIAERLVEGGLVKFESEEQKEKVMKYAVEIMQENVAKAAGADAVGEVGADAEAGFVSVAGKAEGTQSVVDAHVKGVYPELEKGQRPLLASVTRQLRNNETYSVGDSKKFVGRIETLIAGIQKQVAAQKAAAAKEAA